MHLSRDEDLAALTEVEAGDHVDVTSEEGLVAAVQLPHHDGVAQGVEHAGAAADGGAAQAVGNVACSKKS